MTRPQKTIRRAVSLKSHPLAFSGLTVCGLDELEGHSACGVTHVLSIIDPDWPEPPAFDAFGPHFRATFRFHDVIEAAPGIVAPKKTDVEAILAFGRDAGEMRRLLIHCHAGVSRSTAATLMILAQAHARSNEGSLVDWLLKMRPQAWPNSRMVAFADELLGRNGRLTAALAALYAVRLKAQPELAEAMRLGARGREVELGLSAGGVDAFKALASGSLP
jgi:predicted protein tyrosine phosphatase